MDAVFTKFCSRLQGHDNAEAFYQLDFAIRRCLLPRDHVREALISALAILTEVQSKYLMKGLVGTYPVDRKNAAEAHLLIAVALRREQPCSLQQLRSLARLYLAASFGMRPNDISQIFFRHIQVRIVTSDGGRHRPVLLLKLGLKYTKACVTFF